MNKTRIKIGKKRGSEPDESSEVQNGIWGHPRARRCDETILLDLPGLNLITRPLYHTYLKRRNLNYPLETQTLDEEEELDPEEFVEPWHRYDEEDNKYVLYPIHLGEVLNEAQIQDKIIKT
ncbi:hypothetical protein N7463_001552, partial [Penicillium fimorum]